MRLDHNFFCVQTSKKTKAKNAPVSHSTVEEREKQEGNKDEELGVDIFVIITQMNFVSIFQ